MSRVESAGIFLMAVAIPAFFISLSYLFEISFWVALGPIAGSEFVAGWFYEMARTNERMEAEG